MTDYDVALKDSRGNVVQAGTLAFDSATAEPMPKAGGTFSANVLVADGAYVIVASNQAPADGALAASQMALWLDDTNGAGKLMVKAKTANGTVVTASVALA